jgi:uncharacterized RDD family membrane protein YckC
LKAPIDTIVTAETPEGIAIVMRPAGLPVRCVAFLIDAIIRIMILSAVSEALRAAGQLGIGLLLMALFALSWLYPILFELLPAAATPGKRILGLSVMMVNGLPITPAASITRNLMRAVDMLPLFYGFAVGSMLLRADARRLGDVAAGTVVVYRATSARTGGFGAAEPHPPPLPLSMRQRAAITAFAWRATRLTPERAEEIAALAAAACGGAIAGNLSTRLVGIARWLHGERVDVAPTGSPGL